MSLYWLLLAIPILFATIEGAKLSRWSKSERRLLTINSHNFLLLFYAPMLILFVGLRHEVGADWMNYLTPVEIARGLTFYEGMMVGGDPAYGLLTWLSAHMGGGVYLVNLVCAVVFVSGLVVFALNTSRPWLTLCVALPYLVIVVAMGYTRQGVAIGLVMAGMVALNKGQLIRFCAWLAIAALFHKSAIILITMAVFAGRKNWWTFLGVLVVALLMFLLLLAEYVDFLISGYLIAQYESSGAAIRVSMNALPAGIFILLSKRFGLTPSQRSFWMWMSWGALIFIFLLFVSPSSTAVDRLALYWIPLQLFVWSRLPQAMGQQAGTQLQWLVLVLLYAVAVQYVWLFHADHSFAWIPYQFYPWVWLWQ